MSKTKQEQAKAKVRLAREEHRRAYRSVIGRYDRFIEARGRFLAADRTLKKLLRKLGRDSAKEKASALLQKIMQGPGT